MKNSWPAHIYNWLTLQRVRRAFHPHAARAIKQEPLLVSGAFRSGTSVVTLILSKAGFDIGPEDHLLKADDELKKFNPDGFLENYFFMDLSRYIFHLLESSGDNPPSAAAVSKLETGSFSDEDFWRFSLLEIHDDRISNRNKRKVLSSVSVKNIRGYVQAVFGAKPLIKNPHFAVLRSFVDQVFPNAVTVVVFRHPQAWITSAKNVTANADFLLYSKYYEDYVTNPQRVIFFDYDKLLSKPAESISKLLESLGADLSKSRELVSLVRTNENPVHEFDPGLPSVYFTMQEHAVNK